VIAADDWRDAPLARGARRAWQIALVAYIVPITVATHWPRLGFGGAGFVDKIVHFVGFGVLAWLFMNAALFRRPVQNLALGVFWVYFDEITQAIEILGRTFSWYDLAAGWLGCAVVGLLWFGMRLRSRSGTDERLADLTAERLVFARGVEWLRAAAIVFVALSVCVATSFALHGTDGPLLGRLIHPGSIGLLLGAALASVWALVRSHARVSSGRIDAWTGSAEAEGRAPTPKDCLRAVFLPAAIGGALAFPSWLVVVAFERLLFPVVTADNEVDSAGFVALRPIFTAMLAFAGAVVASSLMVRMRRSKTGFHVLRQRP